MPKLDCPHILPALMLGAGTTTMSASTLFLWPQLQGPHIAPILFTLGAIYTAASIYWLTKDHSTPPVEGPQ